MDSFNPHKVALVISDVVMPGTSGNELIRTLRERAPDLPVLFVSGFSDGELDSWASDEHTQYLAKPFRPEEVVARAEALLRVSAPRERDVQSKTGSSR